MIRNKKTGLKILLFILILLILFPLVFVFISFLDSKKSIDYMPDTIMAHISVPSTSELFNHLLELDAADLFLDSSAETKALREQIILLRQSDLWKNPWVNRILNVPLSAALYQDQQMILGIDLGIRSVPLRMVRYLPSGLLNHLQGLNRLSSKGYALYQYTMEQAGEEAQELVLYCAFSGDVLLLSNQENILRTCFESPGHKISSNGLLKTYLEKPAKEDLRILLRSESFLEDLRSSDSMESQLISSLIFPDFISLSLSLSNEQIFITAHIPVESENEKLQSLIQVNSGVPAILKQLPEQTQYASLLALGGPGELLDKFSILITPEIQQNLQKANQASDFALGMDLDELIYSWTGKELGVFAIQGNPEPIFFLQIADEKKRQEVFQKLISSLIIQENNSVKFDGIQIRQLSLPRFLQSLLSAFDLNLPSPYFALLNDYIYFSESAEALGKSISASNQKNWLIKTEDWKSFNGKVSGSSSVELFYSLERSLPFFLKSDDIASNILKLYNRGLFNLRIEGDQLKIALSAVNTGSKGLILMPGFPLERESRLITPVKTVQAANDAARLCWQEDSLRLIEYQPGSGKIKEAELDEPLWLLPSEKDGSLWAVSKEGVVYRYGKGLQLYDGYPLLTGLSISTEPTLYEDSLFLADKEGGLYKLKGTEWSLITQFHSPLLAPAAIAEDGLLAVYPKSFLGQIFLINQQGQSSPGWPQKIKGISYSAPFFMETTSQRLLGFQTQAGDLNIFTLDGALLLQYKIDDIFYTNPVWSQANRAIYSLSEDGTLYRIDLQGNVDQLKIEGISSQESNVLLNDWNQDGTDEIFLSRVSGVLYGFDSDLQSLKGFPLSGGQDPSFADLNGDGDLEIITGGYDKKVRVYYER